MSKKIELSCKRYTNSNYEKNENPYVFVSIDKNLLEKYIDSQPYIKKIQNYQSLEDILYHIIRANTIKISLNTLDKVLLIEKYVNEKGFSSISEFIENLMNLELSKPEICCVNCKNCNTEWAEEYDLCLGFEYDGNALYDDAKNIFSHCCRFEEK